MADKRMVSLALEEGFLSDHVLVKVGDRVVADLRDVSTRVQIGLATTVEVALESGDGEIVVELPEKDMRTAIDAADAAYVGVSVGGGGDLLEARTGSAPLGYA